MVESERQRYYSLGRGGKGPNFFLEICKEEEGTARMA